MVWDNSACAEHHGGTVGSAVLEGWLRSLSTRAGLANPTDGACPYANICEQCDNFTTGPDFTTALQDQQAEICLLREVARHDRVITSIDSRTRRLRSATKSSSPSSSWWPAPTPG